MNLVSASRPDLLARIARSMPSITATQLVAGMQRVTSEVMARGAVVVTRHDQPSMVLMSIDQYLKLEQAAAPDLDGLRREFDDMFARMQTPEAAEAMADAFAMSADELGRAAVVQVRGTAKAKVPAAARPAPRRRAS